MADRDLEKAICLSLEEHSRAERPSARCTSPRQEDGGGRTRHGCRSGPEDDPDLAEAIRLSLLDPEHAAVEGGSTRLHEVASLPTAPCDARRSEKPMPSTATNFLAQRAGMERERLARLKRSREQETSEQEAAFAEGKTVGQSQRRRLSSKTEVASDKPTSRFEGGSLHLTYVQCHWREKGRYIRIDELLETDKLRRAFLSTFVIDVEWLLGRLPGAVDGGTVPVCIAIHGRGSPGVTTISDNLCFVYPPMTSNWGCMHAKLMLLEFDSFLRVVVSSANLVDYDWETLENIAFVQDFPRQDAGTPPADREVHFKGDLARLLARMGVPQAFAEMLDRHDFSSAEARLVMSVPGIYSKNETYLYGHLALARSVSSCGRQVSDGDHGSLSVGIECQTSSLGALDANFLRSFYRSACGLDPVLVVRKANKAPQTEENWPITVVYPSKATVEGSIPGANAAGTICFQRKHWENGTFPKQVMRDCISRRKGSLMHSKVILASKSASSEGWCYLGSHNFTQSAWGRIAASTGKLTVSNWEVGVIVPTVVTEQGIEWQRRRGGSVMVPLPYQTPPPAYGQRNEPWFNGM